MTPDRFADLVAAYGARPDRWPEKERAAALALADGNPACAALLDQERALDAMLDRHRVPVPHGAMVGALLATAPRARLLRGWRAAVGLAATAALGMAAGATAVAAAAPGFIDRHALLLDEQPMAFGVPDYEENETP